MTDPGRFVVGGDGPALVVPARVAAVLARMVDLRGVRVALRESWGEDPAPYELVTAWMQLADWFDTSHQQIGTGSGTCRNVSVPSAGAVGVGVVRSPVMNVLSVKQVAARLGVTHRAVTKRAVRLGGRKVGGRWVFDPARIEVLAAGGQNKEALVG